jgi:hypothetical protein
MGYLTVTMAGTHPELDESVRFVQVFATPSAPEAEVVRSLLTSEGIPVTLKGMTQGPYRMGTTYLLVPEGLESEAARLIEGARADGDAPSQDWIGEDTTS